MVGGQLAEKNIAPVHFGWPSLIFGVLLVVGGMLSVSRRYRTRADHALSSVTTSAGGRAFARSAWPATWAAFALGLFQLLASFHGMRMAAYGRWSSSYSLEYLSYSAFSCCWFDSSIGPSGRYFPSIVKSWEPCNREPESNPCGYGYAPAPNGASIRLAASSLPSLFRPERTSSSLIRSRWSSR